MYSVVIEVQHIERDFVYDPQGWGGGWGWRQGQGQKSKLTKHGHVAYQIEEDE